MIFLGTKEGRARQRIQQLFAKGLYKPQEATSPLAIHIMAISSYIDQWRLYLRAKGDECRTEVSRYHLDFEGSFASPHRVMSL